MFLLVVSVFVLDLIRISQNETYDFSGWFPGIDFMFLFFPVSNNNEKMALSCFEEKISG